MPTIKTKFNRNKHKINDWITPALLKSVTKKNKLYVHYQKYPIGSGERIRNKEIFKTYEKIMDSAIRIRKKLFYGEQFSQHTGNLKKPGRQ